MSVLRNTLSRGAVQLSKTSSMKVSPISFAQRSFSTILESREAGEEVRYIRNQEALRQAEIRANVERILALEDHHDDKKGLVELLGKKEEEKGIISKLGLDDWKFALPVGLIVGIPAIANEVLILDAETQLVACFILFCSTMYTQVGGMMGKGLDDYSRDVEVNLRSADDVLLEKIQAAVEADEHVLDLNTEFKQLSDLSDNISVAQADLLNQREVHLYREAIVKKLDSLNALEEAATQAIRNRMVTQVKAEVVSTFANDKKAKEAALNRAIEVLAGGAKGKLGKDIVGDVFTQALHNYRDSYAKQPAGSDPILKQLEKDVAAVAEAPVVAGKGGNVFVL